ncbi:transporter substrate-binding domain-containing protein [Roseomonas sp. NAR14]|uniref:Transporter substrate-binding domain-containing protein n=1 Tax=Roseomonas acroporae TaxID=2937791 RepID=A0A9X2BWE7_9PROT|nr:transporter substrate-binding domain-containing protein [Roseomonas acroporae]MCK8787723.1 transporter substrate-binding domain-containing protein [Roseomonas acroporae]
MPALAPALAPASDHDAAPRRGVLLLAPATLLPGPPAARAGDGGTLARMRQAGIARVAMDLALPPYAMLDAARQPVGSEVDTARLLCADLGVTLRLVAVDSPGRIPSLLTGKADLIVSVLSITPERERVIGFSRPYAAVVSVLAGPAAAGIADPEPLAGRRVAVTRGSINDHALSGAAPPGARILRFDNDAATMGAVLAGQADCIATAPELVEAINARQAGQPLRTWRVLGQAEYGVGLPRDDTALKDWVEGWVTRRLADGTLAAIHRHWHAGAAVPG